MGLWGRVWGDPGQHLLLCEVSVFPLASLLSTLSPTCLAYGPVFCLSCSLWGCEPLRPDDSWAYGRPEIGLNLLLTPMMPQAPWC